MRRGFWAAATLVAAARAEREYVLPPEIRQHALRPTAPFCPLHDFAKLHGGPVAGDATLDRLVTALVEGETPCFKACIVGAQDLAQRSHEEAERAQTACRACVDAEADTQREVVLRAMRKEANAGCRVPAPSKDRCFVTPQVKYEVVDKRDRRSLNEPEERLPKSVVGGWWLLPEAVRGNTTGLYAKPMGCNKICMPSDGVGSIYSVVFELFAAALETGCTMVFPNMIRAAHGVELADITDFFRAESNCVVGDRAPELAKTGYEIVGEDPSLARREGEADKHHASRNGDADLDVHGKGARGTVYYMSHDEMIGSSGHHALRLSHLRGGMHVCGQRTAGTLARLVLRAKFESGQRRPTAVPPSPPFVAQAPSKASTQVSETAWFDPLFDARPDGKLQLNVVMHVRRGDVNKNYQKEHHGGGIYASHFVPLEVVTEALSILMTAWAPLAEKLGLFFNIHVASEGTEDDFPTTDWHRIVHGVGKMNYRLRGYEGQKMQAILERQSGSANVTALDTMGQMLDADVLMADGKSLFTLAANAWAVNSLFLTYPWLLQLGAPLDHVVGTSNVSTTPLDLEALPEETPLHPVYQDMVRKQGPGLNHPGLTLLEDAHRSEDYHNELALLYEHRQTAVLQGLLANVVAKKRRALERGAHFNWIGY